VVIKMAWPLIIGTLAGTLFGNFLGGGSSGGSEMGSGLIEVGTSKKITKTQDQYSYQSTYAPVTTTTRSYQPVYSYAPQYMINSPYGTQTTKKEIAATSSPEIAPVISPQLIPFQNMASGGGGSMFDEIKPLLLLGGIGVGLYFVFKK